ncbi:hypothetical protein LOZ52_000352 [Ophidiomyces ophidiicola]|uniref:uncharacterized protein n=1 Tax=Ophidiomyces ophidiicola TaxID=1387563 RepID=UPI0020C42A0C|nr:uncharacterized protein LOZ57_004903 [Ophidiomyces ophidiicola]KAI1944227.1 hypothetical protein LOZ57_004903 [Ophidiomyces ophidiicola]KAI2004564.1 hypothetical protein LOZ49_005793 [Ophidiomyces ophidiicola]KAI2014572.1 hypothetical protein LOZ46_005483 [Ophidiomyces ophidiicola]KAI2046444.1 hypothetical protein LOZ43_005873 [Ophidiomyces ophidiicola]KAI2130465.1 hypothetical protein LOZ28_006429 [Ophidiomyces ophidiicola]
MPEDDRYRTSSQFRLWSFTKEGLTSIRAKTNANACKRVKRASVNQPDAEKGTVGHSDLDIDCLLPEEELELVQYYCEKTLELADEYQPPLPTTVRATAIQYIRRFYLTNSAMIYHPKDIMPCALFLATKTENYYMPLRSFAEKIPKLSPEEIIGPEYLLSEGLRYTFDVRHPFRGLDGGMMELHAIVNGQGPLKPNAREQSATELQQYIETNYPPPAGSAAKSIADRIGLVHNQTRHILKAAAQTTDAYFLFSPPQIWLSALLLIDKPLLDFYLDTKFGPNTSDPAAPDSSKDSPPAVASMRKVLLETLASCSMLLSDYMKKHGPNVPPDPARMTNLKRIGKKLYLCQHPEKRLGSKKREGSGSVTPAAVIGPVSDADQTDTHAPKKRKLQGSTTIEGDESNDM